MSERLDKTCRLEVGTRDAVHVPIVVGRADASLDWKVKLNPGDAVKFTDMEFTKFVPCERSEAHGILNPFLEEICRYESVIVFMVPGITSPVRHRFEINPDKRKWEEEVLKMELEEGKKSDPGCAECFVIRNNEVIRL
jgi:hypothetical protein